MTDIVPTERGNKSATFDALVADFKMDEKIKKLFEGSPMESLEDFRYFFSDEKEIDPWVGADSSITGQDLKLQVARVRRAWSAVRLAGKRKEERNTPTSTSEMDDLISDADLRTVKIQFWKRYKLRYPTEVMPGDQILSRLYRELDKRMLTVYDVWKAKTLMHQVSTSIKRKQVADGLFTYEDEQDKEPVRSVDTYLSSLYVYLLALAIVGTNKVEDAPAEEKFGDNSALFVQAPWDILQSYYFRACRQAALIPYRDRLVWLERADTSERAVWVSTFREGTSSIGRIVQTAFDQRGAHWNPPPTPPAASTTVVPEDPSKEKEPKTANKRKKWGSNGSPQEQNGGAGKQPPGSLAKKLRDGTILCPDFNKGTCNSRSGKCAKGVHRCGNILKNGRPCGMRFHGKHNCRRT